MAVLSSMACLIVMAIELLIAKSAALEIDAIVRYLSEGLGSPAAARSFLEEFDHQAGLACSFPDSHPLCLHPELAQSGYRAFRVRNYVAIYSVQDD